MENNQKYKLLAIGCLACTVILMLGSSLYTYQLFASMATAIYSYISGIVGLCFDIGKYIFPASAIIYFAHNKLIQSLTCAILAIVCITVSFFASQSFDLNRHNQILNKAINNSSVTKRQQQLFSNSQKRVDDLQKELSYLRDNKDSLINKSSADLRQQKDSLPRDYITKKSQLQSEINAQNISTKKTIETRIGKLEKELSSNTSELKTINKSFGSINVKTTEGIGALSNWLKVDVGNIVMVKNIMMEILGIAFSILFGFFTGKSKIDILKSLRDKANTVKDKFNNAENKVIVESHNNPFDNIMCNAELQTINDNESILNNNSSGHDVGTTCDEYKDFDIDDIKEYLHYMYNNSNNNISVGITKIINNTNLCNKQVRGIKFYLEKKNIIKSNGVNTQILCNSDEAREKCKL
jgi:hypothetical protein